MYNCTAAPLDRVQLHLYILIFNSVIMKKRFSKRYRRGGRRVGRRSLSRRALKRHIRRYINARRGGIML